MSSPYFLGIFSYIGLILRPFRFLKWPLTKCKQKLYMSNSRIVLANVNCSATAWMSHTSPFTGFGDDDVSDHLRGASRSRWPGQTEVCSSENGWTMVKHDESAWQSFGISVFFVIPQWYWVVSTCFNPSFNILVYGDQHMSRENVWSKDVPGAYWKWQSLKTGPMVLKLRYAHPWAIFRKHQKNITTINHLTASVFNDLTWLGLWVLWCIVNIFELMTLFQRWNSMSWEPLESSNGLPRNNSNMKCGTKQCHS